jgi:hypothetical protein
MALCFSSGGPEVGPTARVSGVQDKTSWCVTIFLVKASGGYIFQFIR